jgi:hypothetical protein
LPLRWISTIDPAEGPFIKSQKMAKKHAASKKAAWVKGSKSVGLVVL